MKTLTKRQALEATIKMWTWLAEHPRLCKDDYIKTHNLTGTYLNNCPCCEYANRQASPSLCDNCPLLKRWSAREGICARCTMTDSPFWLWRQADELNERTKHANAIVAMAKQELSKLRKTKTKAT